ncbi:DUF1902 domain-containing protein [Bosea sp. R86505]|uniref:DUF1902 domain-containing protein n=1 Tax=Bosea sp. R86505 TaxID=3101710 RepID=UPI00366C510C
MDSQLAFRVFVSHDADNAVWFVVESDIPGLNVEAPTLDALVEAVTDLAPHLIDENIRDRVGSSREIAISISHLVTVKPLQAA